MRIAIVGAGPSGLAAAKTLIQLGLSPTVFEATAHLGGLWFMPEANSGRSRLYKSLRTNLSKFTCSFSDFPWKEDSPLFPSAADVHDYLNSYARHFIPMQHIKLSTKVEYVQRNLERNLFELRYRSVESGAVHQDDFDCVIIATGFFNKPFNPPAIQTILNRNEAVTHPSLKQQIIHSLEYYDPSQYVGKAVAVVGGSFTGCEIAAELSKHAKQVHHIISKPSYIVPRYLPRDLANSRTPFYPVDLVFYALSAARLKDMISQKDSGQDMEKVHKSEEEVRDSHRYFEKLDRYAQSPLASVSALSGTPTSPVPLPRPFVSISDGYYSGVHAGKLVQHCGRLVDCENGKLVVSGVGDADKTVEGVDSIILCTGYSPSLDAFLSPDLLDKLNYQPQDPYLPITLFKDIHTPACPSLYAIGMYKGVYFASLEAQARVISSYISRTLAPPTESCMEKVREEVNAKKAGNARAQFPHSDYVGYVCDLVNIHNPAQLSSILNGLQAQPYKLFAPFLLDSSHSPATCTSHPMMTQLQQTIQKLDAGMHIAKNIYDGLLYTHTYAFTRTITDRRLMVESIVVGNVTYTSIDAKTMLYREQGVLRYDGREFEVTQEYIYKYNEVDDTLDVFFVKKGNDHVHGSVPKIDRHFLTLNFMSPVASSPSVCGLTGQPVSSSSDGDNSDGDDDYVSTLDQAKGWYARYDHLCSADLYKAEYMFAFAGTTVQQADMVYRVKGPAKDYVSRTVLTARDVHRDSLF